MYLIYSFADCLPILEAIERYARLGPFRVDIVDPRTGQVVEAPPDKYYTFLRMSIRAESVEIVLQGWRSVYQAGSEYTLRLPISAAVEYAPEFPKELFASTPHTLSFKEHPIPARLEDERRDSYLWITCELNDDYSIRYMVRFNRRNPVGLPRVE